MLEGLSTLLLLGGRSGVWAQRTQRIYRVGILIPGSASAPAPRIKEFIDALAALGYAQGQNIVFEIRGAEGNYDRFEALANDLVQNQVDVIFIPRAVGVRAAHRVTSTIPIVFSMSVDPVALGVVSSLERPGQNTTGFTEESPELPRQRAALLKELLPQAKKFGIVWDANAFGEKVGREMAFETAQAVRALDAAAETIVVRSPGELENALSSLTQAHVDALLVQPSPMFLVRAKQIVALAAKSKSPTLYPWVDFPNAGGLVSLGPDLSHNFRRAAGYVDRILKGAKPGDLPVGRAEKFILVINTKAAKELGIAIPSSVLTRADRVIE